MEYRKGSLVKYPSADEGIAERAGTPHAPFSRCEYGWSGMAATRTASERLRQRDYGRVQIQARRSFVGPPHESQISRLTLAIKRSPAKGLVLRLSFWSLLAAASLFQRLASEPRLVLSGHENYITSLAFAPDGRFLASGSADRTIKIWHPSTGENLKTLSMVKPAPIPSLVFSADGKQLALGGWNKLAFMNIEDGNELSWIDLTNEGGGRLVHAVLLSPDGKTLISAGMNSLRLWDIDSKAIRRRLLDENKSFFQAESVALSHGGKLLASGSNRGLVTLWDMNQEKKLYSFAAHGDKSRVSALTFAPDDRLLATGGADARTVLWQLSPSDAPKEILTLKADTGGINSIAFSADGKLLATAAYHLRVWQVATGKLLFISRADG